MNQKKCMLSSIRFIGSCDVLAAIGIDQDVTECPRLIKPTDNNPFLLIHMEMKEKLAPLKKYEEM